jgi:hypothetical protein
MTQDIKTLTGNARADAIRNLVNSAKGRFVRVDFRKADGSFRRMVVQPATGPVRIAASPAPSPSAARAAFTRAVNHPNLFNVWDSLSMGFRSINLDTVEAIRINGEEITFK